MIKNLLPLFTLAMCCQTVLGQFNDFKYLVVPVKFDAFNLQNQHKTSTITKFLMTNKGFNVVYSDNLPTDLKQNSCLGLNIDLLDESSMFTTKVVLSFVNCDGQVVYTTPEGKSKEKSYEASYKEALENAVNAMGMVNYVYNGNGEIVSASPKSTDEIVIPVGNDIRTIKDEENGTIVNANDSGMPENMPIKGDDGQKPNQQEKPTVKPGTIPTLYAQSVADGYQLVDTTPKVLYKLTSTSVPDLYLVEGDSGYGLLHKVGGKWMLEFKENNRMKFTELEIKF